MIRSLILSGFGAWVLGLCAILLVQTLWRPGSPAPADAIICLGAGMASDTSPEAGPGSARRARHCAELYRQSVAPMIIFTGAGNETRSAAEGMADMARDLGVPDAAVRVEPASHSTIQNAAFSRALLPDETDRVIVVSDAFHLPRAGVIFHMLGYPETELSPTRSMHPGEAWRWCVRESFALWFNLWRAALYTGGGLLGIDSQTRIAWFD